MSDNGLTLGVVADINPEALSGAIPADHEFQYIDLGSVMHGVVNWTSVLHMKFGGAPSRARRVTRPGDVLFGTVRPALESHTSIPQDARPGEYIASTGFAVLRAKQTKTTDRFLYHYSFSEIVRTEARRAEVGSSYPAVNESDIARFRFPDIPFTQQRHIAKILDTLDDHLYKTKQTISKLTLIRQSVTRELLTKGVERISNPWRATRLLDVVVLPRGQVDPRASPYREMTLIAPDHIAPSTGELLERETAESQDAISGKYLCKPNDVIYSKIRPYLRKAVLATEVGLCSADMYPMRPTKKINPRYLLAVLLSEHFTTFADSASMRTGIPKLNRDELSYYEFPLPSRAEQNRIAMVLLAYDRRLTRERAMLVKLAKIKEALMSDLLTGRIRVPVETA